MPVMSTIDPWSLGVPPRSASPADMLDLSGARAPLGYAPMTAKRIVESTRSDAVPWRDAVSALVDALSRKFSLIPERICVGAGTRVLLPAVLQALSETEGTLALPELAPPLHTLCAARTGLRQVRVTSGNPLAPDVEEWKRVLERERPALALLAHPANPGGHGLDRDAMASLLSAALASGTCLIIDEAYADYAEKAEFARVVPLLEESPHLVVMRSFSSLQGLEGLPTAFTLSAVETAGRIRPATIGLEPGEMAARASTAAVGETTFDQMIRERVGRARFALYRTLTEWGLTVDSGVAPWVVVTVPDSGDATKRLAARGLRVRDLAPWGLPGRIRIRAGTEDEVARFIRDAKPVLTKMRPPA